MVRATLAHWVVTLAVGSLLCGCDRGADPRQPAGRSPRLSAAAAAAASAEADLVSAVGATGATAPMSLRFRLPEPPRVGQPLHIELVLVQDPGLDIDSLQVLLRPGDGLAVESDRNFEFQSPAPGATQRMAVTVRAEQPGLLSLVAVVQIGTVNASLTRTFSIPLIAAP